MSTRDRDFLRRYRWLPADAYRITEDRLDACVIVGAAWVLFGLVAFCDLMLR